MKYIFKLNNLGCVSCADKMERKIKKINGISLASIDFMTQKLLVEADSTQIEDIKTKIAAVIKKIEPDCTIAI
ncbi:MAG: cation transporter [Eubacteriales bacterium]|jgi:copper chaperone CopZ|nr:cation transporter [Eubacteriales bacterium]